MRLSDCWIGPCRSKPAKLFAHRRGLLTERPVARDLVYSYIGAKLLYPDLPEDSTLIGDKGYDSNEFREALVAKQITPCIPPRSNRIKPIEYCKTLYKLRHKIEIAFNRLKDWRRIATRYDRCADIYFAAITIAAIVIFWLG